MKARDFLIVIVALALSVGIAFLTRYILQSGEEIKEAEIQQKLATTEVLVARSNLPVGSDVQMSRLKWQEWPERSLHPSYITRKKAEKLEIEGAIVRYSLMKGEPIKSSNIVSRKDKSILSAVTSSGRRAFTITLGRNSHVSGWIAPGDYVDVIVPHKKADRKGFVGETVLTKIKILAVNSNLDKSGDEKTEKSPKTITVEVTPSQAETLAAALKQGNPAISLHSITPTLNGEEILVSDEPAEPTKRVITVIRRGNIDEIGIQQ